MTSPAPSITESQVFTSLRAFLLACVPSGVEVVKGQDNRVSEPKGANFIVMTPIFRHRLSTNIASYYDGYFDDPPSGGVKTETVPTEFTVQVDVHGPNAANTAQVIFTLYRSQFAADNFSASGFGVSPLHAEDPRQAPFLNGEQQVETKWTIDLTMQADPGIDLYQDFAGELAVGLIEVDATYKP